MVQLQVTGFQGVPALIDYMEKTWKNDIYASQILQYVYIVARVE